MEDLLSLLNIIHEEYNNIRVSQNPRLFCKVIISPTIILASASFARSLTNTNMIIRWKKVLRNTYETLIKLSLSRSLTHTTLP